MADAEQSRNDLIEARIDKSLAGAMPVSELGIAFRNMMEVMEFAKMMAVSRAAVPPVFRENPGACLAVVMQANRLGFEPFSFARKCYFVNDNLAYEAQLVHAIIIRNGGFTKRPTIAYEGAGEKRKCIVTMHLPEPDGALVYDSPEIGQITVKNSPLWKSDPDQQLSYYSLRAAARRYVPDVIMGMYDPEEMAAERAKDITPPGKPTTDIAARLAAGKAPDIVYTSAKTAAGPLHNSDLPEDGKSEVAAETAVEASQSAETGSVGTTATEGEEAAPGEAGGPETASAATADPMPSDMFELSLIEELRTALAGVDSSAALKVVANEFAGAMGMASEAALSQMREMLQLAEEGLQ